MTAGMYVLAKKGMARNILIHAGLLKISKIRSN
jgi:hypothetical protein